MGMVRKAMRKTMGMKTTMTTMKGKRMMKTMKKKTMTRMTMQWTGIQWKHLQPRRIAKKEIESRRFSWRSHWKCRLYNQGTVSLGTLAPFKLASLTNTAKKNGPGRLRPRETEWTEFVRHYLREPSQRRDLRVMYARFTRTLFSREAPRPATVCT